MALVPELMVAGLAPNDDMAGTGPCDAFWGLLTPAHPFSPTEASKINASPKRLGPANRRLSELPIPSSKSPAEMSPECVRAPFLALVAINHKCNNLPPSITTGRKASFDLSVKPPFFAHQFPVHPAFPSSTYAACMRLRMSTTEKPV